MNNYESRSEALNKRFIFRNVLPQETDQVVTIEEICFPPHEACTREMMEDRVRSVPDLFLVAVDSQTGKIAGFLTGIATNEEDFQDIFFEDAMLHQPDGANVMVLGLNVLPEYRGIGLAREIMEQYIEREKANGRKALILTCLDEKIAMYEHMGYRDLGISASVWGQEQWHEMIYDLVP